jgi:hypothetical protein
MMSDASTRIGGIRDIPDVEHKKEIQDLGRFAVDEYNKQQVCVCICTIFWFRFRHYCNALDSEGFLGFMQNVGISFSKVVKAQEQVVSGLLYYLTIKTKDGSKTKLYAAKIWVKPWEKFKQLQEFKPVQTLH